MAAWTEWITVPSDPRYEIRYRREPTVTGGMKWVGFETRLRSESDPADPVAVVPCPTCLPDLPGWVLSGGNEKRLPDGRWVWLCPSCRHPKTSAQDVDDAEAGEDDQHDEDDRLDQ